MLIRIYSWLNKNYPQNFIVEKPYIGTLIFLAFCFGFVMLYKPLSLHEARFFNFQLTMAVYLSALSFPVFFIIKILKNTRYYSNPNEWTFLKEISAVAIILLGMGIAVYFIGFLLETPANRWNLSTFIDSCKNTILVGIIPFAFFTLINYRYLFARDIVQNFNPDKNSIPPEQSEKLVRIVSQLKKEELDFYPGQLVYAESDGNYVVFHLNVDNQIQKKIIRNSINNIEEQLSSIPFLMRIHRAFIVNVNQIISRKGNTLGYRLKLKAIDEIIPVSRQHIRDFDILLKKYR